jgi:hypothetical protein
MTEPVAVAPENLLHARTRYQFAVLFLGIISLFALAAAKAADFSLTINREYSGRDCTSGYLAVDGTIQAYALELPWQNNAPLISSIPAGSYPGILRYDHSDQWRIELTGVPGRDHVQIHTGNTPDDTEGCILIGKDLGPGLCKIKAGTSKPAYADLKRAFYGTDSPVSTPDKTITVTVKDTGPPSK